MNSPDAGRDESGGCNGYQGRVPGVIVFNPTAPLQVEDAVACDRQADEQQGTAGQKPTAETKQITVAGMSESARVWRKGFTDRLKNHFLRRSTEQGAQRDPWSPNPRFQMASIGRATG